MNSIVEPAFGIIPLHLVRPSRTNPRKRFNEASLQELAASIKQLGLGQPILVRPLPNTEDTIDCVEVVAGERRYRASQIAGLDTIPAIVRDMTDAEVLEFQLVENLQREDVHPIEEAEGYERLMKEHNFTADQCAEKVGKSRSYIYGRLKFCALVDAARAAFYDGKLNASTALLIARIPVQALQIKATEEITSWNGDEPMSYRRAVQHIQQRYMLELGSARFSILDAKLLPAAGACSACPKRTGNSPELFADVESADVCIDPDCFAAKRAAQDAKALAVAQKKGIPVIECKQLWEATREDDSLTPLNTGMWKFDRATTSGSIEELLPPEARPEPKSYAKLENGTVEPLYDKTAIQEALEKAGLCQTLEQHTASLNEKLSGAGRPESGSAGLSDKELERQAQLAEIQRRVDLENMVRQNVYGKIRIAAKDPASTLPVLRVIACLMLQEWRLPDDVFEYEFDTSSDDAIAQHFEQCDLGELIQLILDTAVGNALSPTSWDLDHNDMNDDTSYCAIKELGKAIDVDIDQVREELSKPADPEPVDEDTPAAAAAGKKGRKKAAAKEKAEPRAPLATDAWPFPTRDLS